LTPFWEIKLLDYQLLNAALKMMIRALANNKKVAFLPICYGKSCFFIVKHAPTHNSEFLSCCQSILIERKDCVH